MAKRNFSMIEYFNRIAAEHTPELQFEGETPEDFEQWHEVAHAKFMELLGRFPEPAPLDAEVVFSIEEDGIIRERVIFNAEEHMSVPAVVLRPADMAEDGSNPAIVCSHGHGDYGKEPVAGNRSAPGYVGDIERMSYDYGWQMAWRGYLTISPDLRVFGERASEGTMVGGRDKCNVHFIRGAILGIYTLTLNIFDMMRCIDYLETRPEVDPERIGMMGLSQGGTQTTFTTAAEPRIKAADIIGYLNPWERFGVNRANFCGSQIVPDVYRYFDTHDIAGLIAPRPLLVEAGVHDQCFFIEDQLISIEAVKMIYAAAGAEEDLWVDVHPGPHAFAANLAFEFFDTYL
ncbi:MAG: alpha/beta hydrolase [Armatimonadota bacterium]